MALGVCVCCTPALSHSFRQVMPHFESLRSLLAFRLTLPSRLRSGAPLSSDPGYPRPGYIGGGGPSNYRSASAEPYTGTHTNYEMGAIKPLSKPVIAYIGARTNTRHSEDGMQLIWNLHICSGSGIHDVEFPTICRDRHFSQ